MSHWVLVTFAVSAMTIGLLFYLVGLPVIVATSLDLATRALLWVMSLPIVASLASMCRTLNQLRKEAEMIDPAELFQGRDV